MDPEQAKAQQGLTFPQTQVVQQNTPALATGLLGPAVQLAQPAAMEAQPGGATLLPAQDNRTPAGVAGAAGPAPQQQQQQQQEQPQQMQQEQEQPAAVPSQPLFVQQLAPAAAAPAPAPATATAATPPAGLPRHAGQAVAWNGPPQEARGLTWAALTPAATAPSVATISDRRVQLPPALAPEPPSLYRLCRQWVQNEPELSLMAEAATPSQVPPLPPRSAEEAAALAAPAPTEPPLLTTAQEPPVDTLLTHHKVHWKTVRQHMQQRAALQSERHAARLHTVLHSGATGMVVR